MKNLVEKSRAYLKSGPGKFADKVRDKLLRTELHRYHDFLKKEKRSEEELERQREFSGADEAPLLSIVVPLYRTKPAYLAELVKSVRESSYEKWELCLADGSGYQEGEAGFGELEKLLTRYALGDVRIRYQRLKENLGIAGNTNAALAMARGEWILFADHDDTLTEDALYEVAAAAAAHPQADLIYSDEDKIHAWGGSGYDPHFKPDYDPVLLSSVNYISHLSAVRRSLAEELGGLSGTFDGAQDYDFLLRVCERAREVVHIDRVLYHWRCHRESTAKGLSQKTYASDAGKRALLAHFQREKLGGGQLPEIEDGIVPGSYRVHFPVPKEKPPVTVIVRVKTETADIREFREALERPEIYENIRVTAAAREQLNQAAADAPEGYLLFLDESMRLMDSSAVRELLGYCAREEIGIVGGKTLNPDGTVKQAGLVLGMEKGIGRAFAGNPSIEVGYMGREAMARSCGAVSADCMMISRRLFFETGGFLDAYPVLYGAELCCRVRKLNKAVVSLPWVCAKAVHAETEPVSEEEWEQLAKDHGDLLRDPYYHRAFERREPGFRIRKEGKSKDE